MRTEDHYGSDFVCFVCICMFLCAGPPGFVGHVAGIWLYWILLNTQFQLITSSITQGAGPGAVHPRLKLPVSDETSLLIIQTTRSVLRVCCPVVSGCHHSKLQVCVVVCYYTCWMNSTTLCRRFHAMPLWTVNSRGIHVMNEQESCLLGMPTGRSMDIRESNTVPFCIWETNTLTVYWVLCFQICTEGNKFFSL